MLTKTTRIKYSFVITADHHHINQMRDKNEKPNNQKNEKKRKHRFSLLGWICVVVPLLLFFFFIIWFYVFELDASPSPFIMKSVLCFLFSFCCFRSFHSFSCLDVRWCTHCVCWCLFIFLLKLKTPKRVFIHNDYLEIQQYSVRFTFDLELNNKFEIFVEFSVRVFNIWVCNRFSGWFCSLDSLFDLQIVWNNTEFEIGSKLEIVSKNCIAERQSELLNWNDGTTTCIEYLAQTKSINGIQDPQSSETSNQQPLLFPFPLHCTTDCRLP